MERFKGRGTPEQNKPTQKNVRPEEEAKQREESKESQGLPSVWDILEREVQLDAPDNKDRPEELSDEWLQENKEISRLQLEMEKTETRRDRLIRDLFSEATTGALIGHVGFFREVTLKEFQEFRLRIEPIPDEKIAEEIRRIKEKKDRIREEYHKKAGRFPRIVFR